MWRVLMMTMMVLAGGLNAMSAFGQIHRCVQSDGKIIYSDAVCGDKTVKADRMLDANATRMRADPYGYQRQLNMQSINRALAQQRGDYESGVAPPSPGGAVILGHNPNERIDAQTERNMDRQRAAIEVDAARQRERDAYRDEIARTQANTPRSLTNCNASGCWDTAGNRYNRTGDGNSLWRSDGKFCTRVGNAYSCN